MTARVLTRPFPATSSVMSSSVANVPSLPPVTVTSIIFPPTGFIFTVTPEPSFPAPMPASPPAPRVAVTSPPEIVTVTPEPCIPPPMPAAYWPPRAVTSPPAIFTVTSVPLFPPPMPAAPVSPVADTFPPLTVTVPPKPCIPPPMPALPLLPVAVSLPMFAPSDCAQIVRRLKPSTLMPLLAVSDAPSARMRCASPETAMRASFVMLPVNRYQPPLSIVWPVYAV